MYCAEAAVCKQVLPALQGYAKAFRLDMSTSAAIAVAAPSYTAQCLAAKQAGAQALIIDASYAAGSRFAPACAQQGYSPVYVIPSGAFDSRYLQLSQVNGAYVPTTNALWFASTSAVDQFKQAMAKYESSTALGPNPMSGWTGGALFGAAAANLPAKPTAGGRVHRAVLAAEERHAERPDAAAELPLRRASLPGDLLLPGPDRERPADRAQGHRAHLPAEPDPGAPGQPGAPGRPTE